MKRKINDLVGDIVIGMSDGLTVPFAVLAGLSGAMASVLPAIVGGITDIVAGSVSMGLGGYLASVTEDEFNGTDGSEASKKDAITSAIVIGLSYAVGGLFPLAPYLIFFHNSLLAQIVSIIFTLVVLFWFGFIKGVFTKKSKWKSGLQTLLIGGVACAIAYVSAKLANRI